MVQFIQNVKFIIVCVMVFISCEIGFPTDDSPPPYPNILNEHDSIIIRNILDVNGLSHIDVRDAIVLEYSTVKRILLDSMNLHNFTFDHWFDSIGPIRVILDHNEIDSLIITDTIYNSLSISAIGNHLTKISPEVNKLKGELVFILAYNNINYISQEIFDCNVSYINIRYNSLCNISNGMNDWLKVVTLDSAWQNSQNCN